MRQWMPTATRSTHRDSLLQRPMSRLSRPCTVRQTQEDSDISSMMYLQVSLLSDVTASSIRTRLWEEPSHTTTSSTPSVLTTGSTRHTATRSARSTTSAFPAAARRFLYSHHSVTSTTRVSSTDLTCTVIQHVFALITRQRAGSRSEVTSLTPTITGTTATPRRDQPVQPATSSPSQLVSRLSILSTSETARATSRLTNTA